MRTARTRSAGAGERITPAESEPQPPARWSLPSGQPLAEFALRSGLLAIGMAVALVVVAVLMVAKP